MKSLLLIVLFISLWIAPIPQNIRQPSKGVSKKNPTSGTQPSANPQNDQKYTDAEAIQAILSTMAQLRQQQTDAQKTEASEKKSTIDVEWWLVYVGIAQAVALILTILAMIRQTGVLKDSAKKQLRAYIGVTECSLKLDIPNIPEGQVWIKNCGQTPAKRVRHWIGIAVLPHPLVSELPKPPGGLQMSVSILSPDSRHTLVIPVKMPIRPQDLLSLYTREHTVYVYGHIVYEDIFGDEWNTDYRFFCGGPDGLRTKKNSHGVLLGLMQSDSEGNTAT
jgi:hypothetical protein